MGRALRLIWDDKDRETVIGWVKAAQPGTRVEFRGPRRTLPQNDRLWSMLTDIVTQGKQLDGKKFTTEEWKCIFMEALGHEERYLPSLDGQRFVSLGQSSSKLTKEEMSDLITFIMAWGAENDVKWSDPTLDSYIAMMRQ